MSDAFRRLAFDQLPERVRDVLRARVERLGYLGEFFQCSAVQPDILVPFMEMTEALKKALPDRLTEVGALTVATLMDNAYERHQHERLSRKLGFGEAWIAAVERIEPASAPELDEAERAVQQLVVAMVERRGQGVEVEIANAVAQIGPDPTIAIMFLVGRYITHAMIVNGLGLAPPVPSIFSGDQG